MTDAGARERPSADSGGAVSDSGGATVGSPTATSVLASARRRLASNPGAFAVLLLAGVVVAATDWFQFHDPVPTRRYAGIQEGRVAVSFGFVVTVLSRATVPTSSLIHLESRWLAATLAAESLGALAVVAASSYALARLLDVCLTPSAVTRYGAVALLVRFGAGRVAFEGTSTLVGIPLLVGALALIARLVPFPGRLVLGEPFRVALSRSWYATRGHGWSLLGVVLAVGLANHLLASVPLAGPVGSAAVGAVHAAVVATVIRELPVD